ncbi:MAG TPA: hypothetical protein VIJ15_12840 [Dermatophilaceae bacterium]
MASMTGTRRIVVAALVLAAASAVFGVIVLASRPMSSTMAGMDMSGSSPAAAPAGHDEMAGMDMSGSNPTPAPTMDPNMAGMDMSGTAPSPTPTMDPDMGGMDMSGSTPPTPTPTMDPAMPGMDMPGMDHEHGDTAAAPVHRPLAPVLGAFGGGSAAVLLTAGMLRRKDRAANLAKKAARAAGRAQK